MGAKDGLELAGTAVDLAAKIADLIARAGRTRQVERQVLLYLDAAQEAVEALRRERQRILRAARLCDPREPGEVAALRAALVTYLQVDTIRPALQKAIDGLKGCGTAIAAAADVRWRPQRSRDRAAALARFEETLAELDDLLQRRLVYDGLPGYSGMLVQTLVPILDLVERIGRGAAGTAEEAEAALAAQILAALDDRSEREWIALAGQVETLIAKLSLAFAVDFERDSERDFERGR